jgi:O-antigen/teichoic acid export membrane protein
MRNLTGYTLGTLIGAVVSLLFWFIINKVNFSNITYSIKFYKEVWRTSFSYGGWQTIGSVGSLVTSQTDKYLLGIYLPASASGIYNVIFQIQQRILSAIFKIAEVMFPLFSASSHEDSKSKFKTLVRSNYILSALGVIIFFPFIILAYPTLKIWINAEFASSGYIVMRCLLLVGAFASFTVVQNYFLMGNARVKQVTIITYFTGCFTAIGSLILIPIYGLDGAAYGVLFAAVSRMGLFYILMKRLFKDSFNGGDYLIASLFPLIPGIFVASSFIYFTLFDPADLMFLLIDYALLAAILTSSIIFVNVLVPRARRHNDEIVRLISEFRGMIVKP